MQFLVTVFIAAVTVNCLMTTINGKAGTNTLAVPYTDMLLPPLEDVQDNNGKDASAKVNATAKATSVYKTTTKTEKKSITNDGKNILAELSIEALLPPLLEAKIERKETTRITTKSTTTTQKPATTLTKRFTTTTKQLYTTTTLKPSDPFEQKLTQHFKEQHKVNTKNYKTQQQQQLKNADSNAFKNYNKPPANVKHVAESQSQIKQVSLTSHRPDFKLQSKTEPITQQYVAKHKTTNDKYFGKQYNYSFDLFLGSTTPRPPKSGLPTITPFPHRLGR